MCWNSMYYAARDLSNMSMLHYCKKPLYCACLLRQVCSMDVFVCTLGKTHLMRLCNNVVCYCFNWLLLHTYSGHSLTLAVFQILANKCTYNTVCIEILCIMHYAATDVSDISMLHYCSILYCACLFQQEWSIHIFVCIKHSMYYILNILYYAAFQTVVCNIIVKNYCACLLQHVCSMQIFVCICGNLMRSCDNNLVCY